MSSESDSATVWDVIVVGAGAAGLLAAARAAERGRRTLLLEKNRKAGVKILMSGGTRCNLTHDCDSAGIIAAFGSAGPFLYSPLAALGPRDLVELFHAEGMPTKTEPGGKVFPQSDRAADVLGALLKRLHRSRARLVLDEPVADIRCREDLFHLATARRALTGRKLILTTGGMSYPGCGTTGDGYRWLAAWGHTIRSPRPALVPLTSDEAWLHALSGITMPNVELRVCGDASTASRGRPRRGGHRATGPLIVRRGSLLFTHFGLSGPVVLDVSREITVAEQPDRLWLSTDFAPSLAIGKLDNQLRAAFAAGGKKSVTSLAAELLPRRLAEALVNVAGISLDHRAGELSKLQRLQLIETLKQCRISVSGSRGFDKAEVTAGGVELDEVDSRTMQSKRVPNLFLAGEILDLDGFIGGYNFQAAFSTGWLAGECV